MKCVRCLAELPRQSQFCLRCGAPVDAAPGGTLPFPQGNGISSLAPPRQNTRALAIGLVLLALMIMGVGAVVVRSQLAQKAGSGSVNARMVESPGGTPASALVQAPGATQGSPMVQAPGNTPTSDMAQAPGAVVPPPADVVDYLAFLKQIEASKKKLLHDQMADLAAQEATLPLKPIQDAMSQINNDNPEPVDPTKKTITKVIKSSAQVADDWNQLTVAFNQKTPPESCRLLHDAYYDHLGKVQGGILNVYNVLEQAFGGDQSKLNEALNAAMKMQNQSGDADASMHKADDILGEVCKTYHLTKEFDISEGSASSMFSGSTGSLMGH